MSRRSTSESIRITSQPRPLLVEEDIVVVEEKPKKKDMNVGMLFFWLIFAFIVVFALLALFAPTWVLNASTGEVDWGKVALTSFIVALVVVILVWLIQSASRY